MTSDAFDESRALFKLLLSCEGLQSYMRLPLTLAKIKYSEMVINSELIL